MRQFASILCGQVAVIVDHPEVQILVSMNKISLWKKNVVDWCVWGAIVGGWGAVRSGKEVERKRKKAWRKYNKNRKCLNSFHLIQKSILEKNY